MLKIAHTTSDYPPSGFLRTSGFWNKINSIGLTREDNAFGVKFDPLDQLFICLVETTFTSKRWRKWQFYLIGNYQIRSAININFTRRINADMPRRVNPL